MSSRIQNARPCVATTTSSPFTTRSVTGTAGRLRCSGPPGVAVVERHVDAGLGAGEQQAAPLRVLADDAHEGVGGEARRRQAPGGAEVGRDVDVGAVVVELVAVHREVRRARRRAARRRSG